MIPRTILTDCVSLLEAIKLPDLGLPTARFEEADRDRIVFGVRYYVYGSIAHYRLVLKGLVMLADEANGPCTNILTRHLMEWAAHATFAKLKLTSLIRQQEWNRAWNVLLKLNGSDLHFRNFGGKHLRENEKGVKIPIPYKVTDFMAVYDRQWAHADGAGAAREDHSLLSEPSHASAACLRQQQRTYEHRIAFEPDEDDLTLALANACCIDWLMCIGELLRVIGDDLVGPSFESALRKIADQAGQ